MGSEGHAAEGGDKGRWRCLTATQEAMVLRSLSVPEGGHYVQQIVLPLSGKLRLEDIRHAWEAAARRYDALRTFFRLKDGRPLAQRFAETFSCSVRSVSLAGGAEQQRDEELTRFLEDDRKAGFDLLNPPLWRFTVLRWESGDCVGVWSFHHALLDGRSHTRVLKAVVQRYQAPDEGPWADPPARTSFAGFLDWLSRHPTEAAQAYWARKLAGLVPAPSLPSLAVHPEHMADEGPHGLERLVVADTEARSLRSAAERHGVTLNNLVQAAWALVLSRYNDVHDVTFGVTRAGRHWGVRNGSDAVGMFSHTVPFRVDVRPEQPLGAWLRSLREQQRAVRGHEFVSTAQIRRWAGIAGGTSLWQTLLVFENRGADDWGLGLAQPPILHEKADQLALAAYAGRELTLTIEFSPRAHSEEQIRTVLGHVRSLLLSISAATPGTPLGELSMMAPGERERVLAFGLGRPVPFLEKPLVRHLEDQARRTPDGIAVEFGEGRLSYAELHGRANQLARRLLEWVQPSDRACVLLDRAPEQIIAWLALLKAGIAYAPVDPASPPQRLESLLSDLDPAIVLTQCDLVARIAPGERRSVALDDPAERAAEGRLSSESLPAVPDPTLPACFLSTSGSTGEPKAAMLSFAGLDFLVRTFASAFDVGPQDRVVQLSSSVFDFALGEILLALSSGATLVMGRWADLRPGPALARFLLEQRITVLAPTPSALRATPLPPPPALRLVLSGGEALTDRLVSDWGRGRRLVNVFGPSECTFWTTRDECRPGEWLPTLGRPVENSRVYVLNAAREPQPVGVPGELYVGGAGVGVGYWKRPQLTASRFVRDPFSDAAGARMYRAGDLVRWLADGRLEFLGRLDHQVKFRGVRLELGEIEAVLARHPHIRHAVVMVRGEALEAWVQSRGPVPDVNTLEAWLAERLPLVFIPGAFHFLSEYPKTGSGKIDRQKLLDREPRAGPEELPDSWQGERVPLALERSVVDLFLEQVRAQQDAIAVREGERRASYAEVERKAWRISRELRGRGLQTEEPVAVLLPPSVALVSSLLGVLMAGGAYVPVDPGAPKARLEFMLRDCGCRIVLTDAAGLQRLDNGAEKAVDVRQLGGAEQAMPVASDPCRRAYIVYTSGSTGQPKGVEVEHHSLTNLVCHYRRRLGLGPGHRATMLANVAFDASAADIWATLCAGGQLLVPPKNLITAPDALIAWLAAEKVTWTFVPTGLAEILFERRWPKQSALRFLLTGGDRLLVRPPDGFPVPVLNTYGPTENTVDSTWSEVASTGPDSLPPSIGRPITNVNAYVLDAGRQPVGEGLAGELYLGGEQVARGYLGQPDLTAERFLPDPFVGRPGARMYRTGDWVRWSPDGELEFLGRQDRQVQIRGNRVELAEIEAALLTHPDVRHVCCVPGRADDRVAEVVAHVVPGPGGNAQVSELQAYLQPRLPPCMIPAVFILHPRFPLTTTGKVDRAALGAVRPDSESPGRTVAPENGLESALARVWGALLPAAKDAPQDATFEALGGDSLAAVRLQLEVEDITQRPIALSSLLLRSTFAGFCQAVESSLAEMEFQPVLALRRSGSRPPLFCLYDACGDVHVYSHLVEALGEDQPVYGIRSPALPDPSRIPASMESAARELSGMLTGIQPEGAPALVGYSWAGLLAFETARELVREHGRTGFTGLIGTACPPARITRTARFLHFAATLPRWAWELVTDDDNRLQRLSCWRAMASRTKRVLIDDPVSLPMPGWASSALSLRLIEIAREYRPAAGPAVELDYFRERDAEMRVVSGPHPLDPGPGDDRRPDAGWERWAGSPTCVHWIEGGHQSILKPPLVHGLARAIRQAMDRRAE